MNVTTTLTVTKAAAKLSQLLGRGGGGALPGLVAERLDPRLSEKLAAGLSGGVIVVTGTNGKTTTTKLIAEFLAAKGLEVVSNSSGSNLKRGVASALIRASDLRGKMAAKVGLFEVDEASLRLVAPQIQPTHIVVTNLFRDQLDRYGELDSTAKLIGEGIAATEAQVYLNADDPLVASLASYVKDPARVHYFGIEGVPVSATGSPETAADSDRCPVCHTRLDFARIFYGHIGHYRFPKGDFSRPAPAMVITNVEEASRAGSRFVVAVNGKRSEFSFPLPGTYNLYNALAALSLGQGFGLELDLMRSSLSTTTAAFGRVEQIEIQGRTICLLLIKNPAGFTQVLETFLAGRDEVRALFVINDLHADGRDVSWLWDVPLEVLAGRQNVVFTTGIRGADMAVRLHYAGVEAQAAADAKAGLKTLIEATPVGGTAYVLPTYTAMLEVRKLLSNQTELTEIPR